MKYAVFSIMIILASTKIMGQDKGQETILHSDYQNFGKVLNLAGQLGYSIYAGKFVPVVYADYEFKIAKNITMAPSAECYSYHNHSYWGDAVNAYKNYDYREIIIPIGLKGSYYLNSLLHTSNKWDIYVGASLEYIIRNTNWDNENVNGTSVNKSSGNISVNLHTGVEYHVDNKFGIYIDLSTGVSVLGIAIHHK